jgi:hypothetical protein
VLTLYERRSKSQWIRRQSYMKVSQICSCDIEDYEFQATKFQAVHIRALNENEGLTQHAWCFNLDETEIWAFPEARLVGNDVKNFIRNRSPTSRCAFWDMYLQEVKILISKWMKELFVLRCGCQRIMNVNYFHRIVQHPVACAIKVYYLRNTFIYCLFLEDAFLLLLLRKEYIKELRCR